MIRVKIPTQLRPLVAGKADLNFDAIQTVSALIEHFRSEHSSLADRILDEKGALRRFVNVYVGDEDIRFLDGVDTKLQDGDVVSILPAVAGGASSTR